MKIAEKEIIQMLKEEYENHLYKTIQELDEKPSDGMNKKRDVEDPGNTKKDEKPKDKEPRVKLDKLSLKTRVTHLPSSGPRGFEYTVVSIGETEVTLQAGDGEITKVSKSDLEKDYVVD
ncbi:hypothetical protein OAA09_00655 [bacterium]|nr:hypothetical protein [bacterium]